LIVERRAARLVLISDGAVLLIRACDPAALERGEWWLTPGGGVEDGESLEEAASREAREETGFEVAPDAVGPVVATRESWFGFDNVRYHQTDHFFALSVDRFTPDITDWDTLEQRALLEPRWWPVDDLATMTEPLYPSRLADLVRAVTAGPLPAPLDLTEQPDP
jgi:8-oxo-dGTP pyrophosphatase MutT (NUDIX family)